MSHNHNKFNRMTILTEQSEISEFQNILFHEFKSTYKESEVRSIHSLASDLEMQIYHDHRTWYGYKSLKGRHLNVFGDIYKSTFNTQFQLSIPTNGLNKKMGGVFGKSGNRKLLLYRGHITGITGLSKKNS